MHLWQAGFTKTVGLELAQKGNITCNAICPGYVLTDLVRNQLEATSKARGIPKVTLAADRMRRMAYFLQFSRHALIQSEAILQGTLGTLEGCLLIIAALSAQQACVGRGIMVLQLGSKPLPKAFFRGPAEAKTAP